MARAVPTDLQELVQQIVRVARGAGWTGKVRVTTTGAYTITLRLWRVPERELKRRARMLRG